MWIELTLLVSITVVFTGISEKKQILLYLENLFLREEKDGAKNLDLDYLNNGSHHTKYIEFNTFLNGYSKISKIDTKNSKDA